MPSFWPMILAGLAVFAVFGLITLTSQMYNLDSINRVAAGDVVARIIKEVEGTPGKDVYGETRGRSRVLQ